LRLNGCLATVAALSLAAGAAAQEPVVVQSPPPEEARPTEAATATAPAAAAASDPAALPTKDLFDILRELRHKPEPPAPGPEDYKNRMVAAAPVLTYGPTTGFGLGAAGNIAFYRGFPDTTRISSIVASVTATTKDQVLVNAKVSSSTLGNRWRFEGDNRLYWTSQKTYGLGTATTQSDAVDQKYDYFRFYETFYRQVVPHTYLGAGFLYSNHTDVRPADDGASAAWPFSPYVAYSEKHGFDPESQTSAGLSLNALYDSRDGSISPSRGLYARASYSAFFEGFLGGASDWQQVGYDVRTYLRLSRDARHKLAFWLSGDFVVAGVAPYLDLPATGMDTYGRTGRGYPQGRFRGEKVVYGEAEYRWTMTRNGLFGMVAFLNTETIGSHETGEKLFDSYVTGAGVGLRAMLNKRSQTNLCLDIGWGQDGTHAVYFAVQEAF
jgi:outer membrane protein assembly factor BamA